MWRQAYRGLRTVSSVFGMRRNRSRSVAHFGSARIPTYYGEFFAHAYRSVPDGDVKTAFQSAFLFSYVSTSEATLRCLGFTAIRSSVQPDDGPTARPVGRNQSVQCSGVQCSVFLESGFAFRSSAFRFLSIFLEDQNSFRIVRSANF